MEPVASGASDLLPGARTWGISESVSTECHCAIEVCFLEA